MRVWKPEKLLVSLNNETGTSESQGLGESCFEEVPEGIGSDPEHRGGYVGKSGPGPGLGHWDFAL